MSSFRIDVDKQGEDGLGDGTSSFCIDVDKRGEDRDLTSKFRIDILEPFVCRVDSRMRVVFARDFNTKNIGIRRE